MSVDELIFLGTSSGVGLALAELARTDEERRVVVFFEVGREIVAVREGLRVKTDSFKKRDVCE